MKKVIFGGAIILILMFSSCVSMEIIDGVPQTLGVMHSAKINTDGVEPIASYWQIGPILYGYNLSIDIGYDDFIQQIGGRPANFQRVEYIFGMLHKTSAYSR